MAESDRIRRSIKNAVRSKRTNKTASVVASPQEYTLSTNIPSPVEAKKPIEPNDALKLFNAEVGSELIRLREFTQKINTPTLMEDPNNVELLAILNNKIKEVESTPHNKANILYSLSSKESGLLANLFSSNSSLTTLSPFSSEHYKQIYQLSEKVLEGMDTNELRKSLQALQNTIKISNELQKQCETTIRLVCYDLTLLKSTILHPLVDDPTLLAAIVQAHDQNNPDTLKKLPQIQYEQIRDIDQFLQEFQEALHQYGRLRIQSALSPNDITTLRELQKINRRVRTLIVRFDVITHLNTMLSTLDEKLFDSTHVDKIKLLKNNIKSIYQDISALISTVRDLENEEITPERILLLRIARGDFFHPDFRERLNNAAYSFYSAITPEKLIISLTTQFPHYTEEQKNECLIFLSHYLKLDTNTHLIFSSHEYSPSAEAMNNFIKLLDSNQSAHVRDVLEKRLHDKQSQKTSPTKTKSTSSALNLLFLESLTDKDQDRFINIIEDGFASRFLAVDLSELSEKAWEKDNQRLENKQTLLAPHIREYSQYTDICRSYFIMQILFKIDEAGKIKPREDIQEVKKIYSFFEDAAIKAYERGAIGTAFSITSALNSAEIVRLKLSDPKKTELLNHYFSNNKDARQALAKKIKETLGLPFLGSIQAEILLEYEKKHNSEFEKRFFLGKILKTFHEKKFSLAAQKRTNAYFNPAPEMAAVLNQLHFLDPPILPTDIIVNKSGFTKIATYASQYIQPEKYNDYSLEHFQSISELKKHLQYCYQRLTDFHLIDREPHKEIINFIIDNIKKEKNLNSLKDAIFIIELIDKIDLSQNRKYMSFESDLASVLSSYQNRIAVLLAAGTPEAFAELNKFFYEYNNNLQIRRLRNTTPESFSFFSENKKIHDVLKALDKKQTQTTKLDEITSRESSQRNYAQLLDTMLEGGSFDLIPLVKAAEQNEHTDSELLPSSEFPVLYDEPEHPRFIGINTIYSFLTDKEKISIEESFSTKQLIIEFKRAFPWTADSNSLHLLAQKPPLSPNLLGTNYYIEPGMQFSLIQYILISLDALGKICGLNGELAIPNYPLVKEITDNLHLISQKLEESNIEENVEFSEMLDELTQNMKTQNKEFYDLQKEYNPKIEVYSNTLMNQFCHINEALAAKRLNLSLKESSLTPPMPPTSIRKQIAAHINESNLSQHKKLPP